MRKGPIVLTPVQIHQSIYYIRTPLLSLLHPGLQAHSIILFEEQVMFAVRDGHSLAERK